MVAHAFPCACPIHWPMVCEQLEAGRKCTQVLEDTGKHQTEAPHMIADCRVCEALVEARKVGII